MQIDYGWDSPAAGRICYFGSVPLRPNWLSSPGRYLDTPGQLHFFLPHYHHAAHQSGADFGIQLVGEEIEIAREDRPRYLFISQLSV